MLYTFKSGNEFIKLKIDRIAKRLEISSKVTNYRFIPQPFFKLFGTTKKTLRGLKPPTEEESKKEMEESESWSDEEFEKKLIGDFMNIGYGLIKKED